MAETEPSDTFDIPEITSAPADDATTDVRHQVKGAPVDSALSEADRTPLRRRLADAFREGVASARPDYVKSPQHRIPPVETKTGRDLDPGEILNRAAQQGRSAAVAVQEQAAIALDYAVRLARKTPAATQKFTQAFRDGAASVRSREGVERKERVPQSARERPAFAANETLAMVSHLNEAARTIFVGVVEALKPGPDRNAWRGIRRCKRRITDLYTEIGREAVNAWDDGPVATEKLAGLLDELRKNEDEIQKLTAQIAAGAAAKTAGATRTRSAAQDVVPPVAEPAPEHTEHVQTAPRAEASRAADPAVFEEPAEIQEEAVEEAVVKPVEAAPQADASAGADSVVFEEPAAIREEAVVGEAVVDAAVAAPRKDASAVVTKAQARRGPIRKGLPKSTKKV